MNVQRILPYAALACIMTAVIIASCRKEPVSPAEPVKPPASVRISNPLVFSHSAPVYPRAYVASYTVTLCEPGQGDSNIDYFTASNGGGQTTINSDFCEVTGVAEDPYNNTIYVASDANGVSTLYKLDPSTGAASYLSDLCTDGTCGTPFHVEEIEFDLNGNMFLLRKGDPYYLYKIPASTINSPPTDIAPTQVGAMFTGSRVNWLETLCLAGNGTIYLSVERSTTGSTSVYSLNLSTAAPTLIGNYPVPNQYTHNISSYYYNGYVYIIRDDGAHTGTVYQLYSTTTINTLANQLYIGATHDAFYGANYLP